MFKKQREKNPNNTIENHQDTRDQRNKIGMEQRTIKTIRKQ